VTTGVLELDAGGWLALHRHTAPEVYVLAGRAVVAQDGEETTVGPSALVRFPADAEPARALDEPARVLFLFPSTAFRDVVHRFDEEAAA
jgi:quercetin dioxygenase-like cupin family protein